MQSDAMPLHLTAESLCPLDLVELLVDDFFTSFILCNLFLTNLGFVMP